MRKTVLIIYFLFIYFTISLTLASVTHAITNPLSVENNFFGIHIHDENDLVDAANLVNSSGGDWGYVTLVIRADERDTQRWQNAFNKMRELHLIPIVRIATNQEGSSWSKPTQNDVVEWVEFLSKLNWVVQNRYVVIGNEPNHATEWGGTIDPVEYANFLKDFSISLKKSDENFFVLPAGLDSSSPDNKTHMSSTNFIKKMIIGVPDILDYIDGWTSHSYPNPNFSAKPQDTGIKSISGYKDEISLLKSYGLQRDLPIFITETGWAHETDNSKDFLSIYTVTKYYSQAYEIWKNDNSIVAITPFIINYSSSPFDVFSFKKQSGEFYDFYNEIQKYLKKPGNPNRINTASIISDLTPEVLQKDGLSYSLSIMKNTGQIIWELNESYDVKIEGYDIKAEIGYPLFSRIDPGHIGILLYRKL